MLAARTPKGSARLATMLALALALLLPGTAMAVDIPATCADLQAKLTAADNGHVIILNGLCTGQFTLPSFPTPVGSYKQITLKGAGTDDGFDRNGVDGRALSGTDVHVWEIQDLLFRDGTTTGDGGAIAVDGESAVRIRNSRFFNNHADGDGGAVHLSPTPGIGGLVVSSSTFGSQTDAAEINDAGGAGGAIAISTPGAGQLSGINGSTFAGNLAGTKGGAVDYQLTGPNPVENFAFDGNTLIANKARTAGGGARIAVGSATQLDVTNSLFQSNSVEDHGSVAGAPTVHAGGGLAIESVDASLRQHDNRFIQNAVNAGAGATGYRGGGQSISTSAPSPAGESRSDFDRFTANTLPAAATSDGGGLATSGAETLHMWLGAVAANTVGAGGRGGGIAVAGGKLELSDTTVAGNSAGSRASLSGTGTETLELHNTIVYRPPLPDIGGFATVIALHSDACSAAGMPFPGAGNICADPLLANAAGGDIHQTLASPTVDAGDDALFFDEEEDPDSDFEGDPRPTDGDGDGHTVDIGADEGPAFVAQPPPPPVVPPQCADGKDNDGDGAPDLQDPGCRNAADTNEGDESVRDLVLCGRRTISLVRADALRGRVVLSGLVATSVAGKPVAIYADIRRGKRSKLVKVATVKPNAAGQFTARLRRPPKRLFQRARYQARVGGARSVTLKLPQSLASASAKTSGSQVVVRGKVQRNLLGKRNAVVIERIVCGRYSKVGSAKPDKRGNYVVRFARPTLATAALYRARTKVLRRPGSKRYVTQFARAIGITLSGQSG